MAEYSNLIVKDEEFQDAGKKFDAFHKVLTDTLKQYKNILITMSETAVKSGSVHDALLLFIEYVKCLEEITADMEGRCAKISENFIGELEQVDRYLYDAKISKVSRDFSQDTYEHLLDCLDDPWCETTDSFGDWIKDKIMELLDFFNWEWAKKQLQDCHGFLLDYNDETKAGLTELFTAVHELDGIYGRSVAGAVSGEDYHTAYYHCVSITMYCIRDMLNEMAALIDPSKGGFTVGQIHDRLGNAYKELKKYYNATVRVSKLREPPTIPEISDFASQPWANSFFGPYNGPIDDYICSLSDLDAFWMIIFEMFGITKDKIIHGGDGKLTTDEIIALIQGHPEYLLTKRLVNQEGYEVYMAKKQLLGVLQEMCNAQEFSETANGDALDDCQTFVKFMKEYGDGWYEYMRKNKLLDGRTKTAREFKEFSESMGGTAAILKYGEAGLEYLTRLFTDYSYGIEVIDSFTRNNSGDETVLKAAAEIRELYNKEFRAWVDEAAGIVQEFGYDYALKAASKACPVVNVVTTVGETIDVVGEVTGLGTKADNMYNSLIYHQLYASSSEAYGNALENFKAQTPGTEEYDQAASDLANCFNLHKQNTVALYKAMAGASAGDQQAYYEYCAKQVGQLTMKTSQKPYLMSYEEFCKLGG